MNPINITIVVLIVFGAVAVSPFIVLLFTFTDFIKTYEESKRIERIHELKQNVSNEDFKRLMGL